MDRTRLQNKGRVAGQADHPEEGIVPGMYGLNFESDPLNLARRELGCPHYSDGDHLREYSLPMRQEQLERNGWRIQYQERRHGAILAVANHATTAV